jgi:hypothetical protein
MLPTQKPHVARHTWQTINLEIYKNNKPLILTITGKIINNQVETFIAFDNFGSEIFLTFSETLRAENLLLREKTYVSESEK